ncbi:amylo-alpha-1,6-glucosidase [Ferroplasma acidiphilum]|jgi:glycogen debranching enzyme|uniref:amylo-alpha-1,6-glucosidase n=1 Tax=Ferroplasma acidiphilum TaxID=74969 RepID=UPI0023F03D71|nr:amylo-alpha-1,6-glucosidase [Ferroplasma acidiphilum]
MEKELEEIRSSLLNELNKIQSVDGYPYAGYPRFMELFGRDSLISSLQLSYLYPDFLKHSLEVLSKYQGNSYNIATGEEPGKILHELSNSNTYISNPDKESWVVLNKPIFFSVDSTPLFIISAILFMKKHSEMYLSSIIKSIEKAVIWLLNKSESTGFLTYNTMEIHNKLASMGWMDGSWDLYSKLSGDIALIEVQAYTYEALRLFNEIFPFSKLHKIIDDKLSYLRNNINKFFWIDSIKYYSPAISISNGTINALKNITSGPGHLLITDIIDSHKKKMVVETLFGKNMMTSYGIRTVATNDNIFNPFKYQTGSIWPNDNWIIMEGLKRSGFSIEAEKLRVNLLNAVISLKEPLEYYSVDINNNIIPYKDLYISPCEIQAWTIGMFLNVIDNKFHEGSEL